MISAKAEHYTCMVDLGHAGHLKEAENIIKAMPCKPDVAAWKKKERGVKKQLCCTWIEVNNEVHTFVVDDEDHPRDD
ncbi:unnamed protein product [Sphagnum jensenii]